MIDPRLLIQETQTQRLRLHLYLAHLLVSGLIYRQGPGIYCRMPMSLPPGAVPANLPADVRPQIVTACKRPPSGDGWLHEIKHDGHRLVAILPGDGKLMLLSRNGYDRTRIFRKPFRPMLDARLPAMVLDGEIVALDDVDRPSFRQSRYQRVVLHRTVENGREHVEKCDRGDGFPIVRAYTFVGR